MQDMKVKIWVGIGAFVLGGAASSEAAVPRLPASAPVTAERPGGAPAALPYALISTAQIAEAGEGGEGGEEGATAGLPPRTAATVAFLMMRGHLRAGADLLTRNDLTGASLHFAHPQAELYHKVEKALAPLGIAPFEKSLRRLVDLTARKAPRKEIEAALDAATADVEGAIAKASAPAYLSPAETARAAIAVLTAAASEYAASIKNGAFSEVEEYQDARAFVLVTGDFLAKAAALRDKDRIAHRSMSDGIRKLADALQSPVPPKKPSFSTGAMYSTVAEVELAASSVVRAGSGGGGEGGEGGEGGK